MILLNPECRDGNHHKCDGLGWEEDHDMYAACPCDCHRHGLDQFQPR